ncbi:MAG: sodium/proline symporter [Hyphomonadaceae bacterium]
MITMLVFLVCLAAFTGIGLASVRKATGTQGDYYLASKSVSPALAGLSAVATNNSGYMFIGVIGFTYATGLAAIWLMIGWIVGDIIASLFVHRRLREATGATKESSFAAVIALWSGEKYAVWRRIAAVLSVVFLGAYAAAQIAAGGKALQGVLGWTPQTGALISAALILAYSAFGGIRASIWTDAAQSIVMVVAMALLLGVAIGGRGGYDAAVAEMAQIPHFLDLFPRDLLFPGALGMGLFVLGWMAAGLSVIGQPHIMVRFMALREADDVGRARLWYYSYFTLFYGLATGVGLMARLYLPDLGALDPELALPTMAVELLPEALVGVILAGIFAATMSTADSLVLSCSAAITHDLTPTRMTRPWMMKAATGAVTLLALAFALSESRSVFSLVILAWSTLACAFAPILILFALGRRLAEWQAVVLMLLGVAIAFAWRALGWEGQVYEGLPGIAAPLFIGFLISRRARAAETQAVSEPPLGTPAD